jgi:hypothetical protein
MLPGCKRYLAPKQQKFPLDDVTRPFGHHQEERKQQLGYD